MTRISVVTVAAFAAMITWGCGSSTNSTGTPAATTDMAGAVDSGAPDTTAQADTNTAADVPTQADVPVDSGPVDAGTPDAGPPVKQKCPETDSACINTCAQGECTAELTACGANVECGKVVNCLNDCGKTPPVQLPGEATWTCSQSCFFNFGEQATQELFGRELCVLSQCVATKYPTPCGANATCQTYCSFDKCDVEMKVCLDEPACIGFFACLNTNCTDQATQAACAATCEEGLAVKHGQASAQKAKLAYTSFMLCGQSKCQ